MSNVDGDTPELAEYYHRVSDFQFETGLQLMDALKIGKGDAILDVGCGTGRLALYVSKITGPSGKVIGIDPAPYRIQVARDSLAISTDGNVSFNVGRGEDLAGLSDQSFDAVYYCAVFHWIDDKPAALREAYRVLKPGGKIGIITGSSDNTYSYRAIKTKILSGFPDAVPPQSNARKSRRFSVKELETMLKEAGFTDMTFTSKTINTYFNSPEEVFRFLKASSSGQPSSVPQHIRPEYLRRMSGELEKMRTPKGIEIAWNPLFVVARKP